MQTSKGRLVVPMYGSSGGGILICFSDTHGSTWQSSKQKVGGTLATEPEVTELFGSPGKSEVRLYMTVRNDQPGLPRQYTTSSDSGLTWAPLQSLLDVRDPDCKGGITRWPAGRALVLTHADSCTARANMTVRLSVDGGVSFPFSLPLDPVSGYSTAEMVGANLSTSEQIGLVYEHFVEDGVTNCSIVFATIRAPEIMAAGAAPPPPPLPPFGNRPVVTGSSVRLQLGSPRQLRNSSTGNATLRSRPLVQTVVLGNGVTAIANGSCASGGCLWLTRDVRSSRAEWTKVDVGAHHDESIGSIATSPIWKFKGAIPTCAALQREHGWDLATCEARRSRGVCTSAVLDTCGNHEDCRPQLCASSGGELLAAISNSSIVVCYDMLGCPGAANWSSVWCLDVFGIER